MIFIHCKAPDEKPIQGQLSEAQAIQKYREDSCLNSKNEYHEQRLKIIVIEGQTGEGSVDSRSKHEFTRKVNDIVEEDAEPDKDNHGYKCKINLKTFERDK